MKAIFKRELKAYFTSPLGYVILGIMLFFLGNGFSMLISSDYGNISYLFYYVNTYTMLIPPLITMRLFSEERKQLLLHCFSPVQSCSYPVHCLKCKAFAVTMGSVNTLERACTKHGFDQNDDSSGGDGRRRDDPCSLADDQG